MNIGIVVLATNVYFVLGIRFIKKFMHHYKGDARITFYFFSDTDPSEYICDCIDVVYFPQKSNTWMEATNQKFESILSIKDKLISDYLFYFDADTDISKEFNEQWFLGDMVAGQHYADQDWMKQTKGFDRHEGYNAYVPYDTELPQMYYYGAFFGGTSENCIQFCNVLRQWQVEDQSKGFEPDVNDESYINKYLHYNPPAKVVMANQFEFGISSKGGIQNYRDTSLDITNLKSKLKEYKNDLIDVRDGDIFKL